MVSDSSDGVNWRIIFAFAGLALIGAAKAPQPPANAQQQQAATAKPDAAPVTATITAKTTEIVEAPKSEQPCGNGRYGGDDDLCAQWKAADAGATVVAFTESDAELLGYYLHPGELTVVGRGVSGEVKGKLIVIGRLSVGNISADNVPAVIIPEGLPVSLLGQSFLSRIAHVTISADRMTMKN